MLIGVLKTDGGAHSSEKLAIATTGQIIQIGADASGTDVLEARRLENQIIDYLEKYHASVQSYERDKLAKVGTKHLSSPLDPEDHDIDKIVDGVILLAKGSVFEEHFAKPEVRQWIRGVVCHWTSTAKHIERSWHADGYDLHPETSKAIKRAKHDHDDEHVVAFKSRYGGESVDEARAHHNTYVLPLGKPRV